MKQFSYFLLIFISLTSFSQSISLTPNGTSLVDIKGNTATPKGILIPRYTSVQKNNISTPSDGMLVYDTDTKNFWYYNAATPGWTKIAAGNVGLDLPYSGSASSSYAQPVFQINNTSANGPWGILATTPTLSNDGIAMYGLDLGIGIGVYGRSSYNTGIKGESMYGGLAGHFIGGVRVAHENSTYDVPELELLRGIGGAGIPAPSPRDTRIYMGKYTSGGFNNRWIINARVNGFQSQPNDRFRIQYSTNNAANIAAENYSTAEILIIQPNGNIGVGVDPTEKLDINGNLKFSGKLSANGAVGNIGEVLTSSGASTGPQWKSATSNQYSNLIIANLSSSGQSVSSLNGNFTLTKPSKIIVNIYVGYEKNVTCASNCPIETFKLSTCIGNGSGCINGREVTVSQTFEESINLGSTLLLAGNAQKIFSLPAGAYNYATTFTQTPTAGGYLKGGNDANATQVSIQIIEN